MQFVNASNDLPYSRKRKWGAHNASIKKKKKNKRKKKTKKKKLPGSGRKTKWTSRDKAAMIVRKHC
jgi:hypothetical protein